MGRAQTPETCEKIGALCRERWAAGAYANRKGYVHPALVTWTDDMRATLIRMYWLGRDLDIIADRIGVGCRELTKEKRRLGLGSRRHIKGFYARKLPEGETFFEVRI